MAERGCAAGVSGGLGEFLLLWFHYDAQNHLRRANSLARPESAQRQGIRASKTNGRSAEAVQVSCAATSDAGTSGAAPKARCVAAQLARTFSASSDGDPGSAV